MGITSYSLMIGLFGTLKKKGVLSQEEIVEMIDLAVLGLEEMGLGGAEAQAIHRLLETTRGIVEGKPFGSTPSEGT
jgi:hypothetical protein